MTLDPCSLPPLLRIRFLTGDDDVDDDDDDDDDDVDVDDLDDDTFVEFQPPLPPDAVGDSRVLGHRQLKTTKRATSFTEWAMFFKTDVREYTLLHLEI